MKYEIVDKIDVEMLEYLEEKTLKENGKKYCNKMMSTLLKNNERSFVVNVDKEHRLYKYVR